MTNIQSQALPYTTDGVNMQGYLAWDADTQGRRPVVLVVHEWWGNDEHVKHRARMLAELGYTAMAVDLYGEGRTADNPEDAGALMSALLDDMAALRARFHAAVKVVKSHSTVNPDKTAAIGYCLGGGVVLHMARYGAELDAVASFHGSLPLVVAPDGEGVDIAARVVAYNGEDDPFVSVDAIKAFRAEMEKADADYQFINMPGAVHAFTNPAASARGEKFGLPLRYNALADECSWAHMRLLLTSVFR